MTREKQLPRFVSFRNKRAISYSHLKQIIVVGNWRSHRNSKVKTICIYFSETRWLNIYDSFRSLCHNSLELVKLTAAEWRIHPLINLPSLVKTMAWRLVGAKPLSGSLLEYQLLWNLDEQIINFHSRKLILKCRRVNGGHFVSASMC